MGINLLREGLDMPEVSLVAIFDADKEGFLRSEGSLIQTIGRAARNVAGKAILYADKITNSMQRALDETERRRVKQLAFNKAHGITPKSIKKSVADIMEGARADVGRRGKGKKAADGRGKYDALSPDDMHKQADKLEQRMFKHAENLEFEEAAKLRDEIHDLRRVALDKPH